MFYKITIATGLLVLLQSCGRKKTETALPVTAPVTEAVFASGKIEAADLFTVHAITDGYIAAIYVRDGDSVKKGQLVYRIENEPDAIQEKQAAANLATDKLLTDPVGPQLSQLKVQLGAAAEKYQADKLTLERITRLYNAQAVSRVEYEQAELNLKTSLSNLESIQHSIDLTTENLKRTLSNSTSQYQVSRISSGYNTYRSPDNYRVYSVLKKRGELVRKGEAVVVLGRADKMIAMLNIDEAGISKVKTGQQVLMELNTEKSKILEGVITRVYPSFNVTSQSFTAEVAIQDPDPFLMNGTLLQANIITGKKDKALLIPKSCLLPDGRVCVKRKDIVDTVKPVSGIVSSEWVEIISGIHAGELLIKQ